MIIIEKMKVLLDVQNKNNPKPFMLPFVASDNGWMNQFLKSVLFARKLFEQSLELIAME